MCVGYTVVGRVDCVMVVFGFMCLFGRLFVCMSVGLLVGVIVRSFFGWCAFVRL